MLACRDLKKGEAVRQQIESIRGSKPTDIRIEILDLASLASVAAFARRIIALSKLMENA